MIKNKYDIGQFDLIDGENLEVYSNELLDNEDIVVEPKFIQDNEQENYKIVVKFKEKNYV